VVTAITHVCDVVTKVYISMCRPNTADCLQPVRKLTVKNAQHCHLASCPMPQGLAAADSRSAASLSAGTKSCWQGAVHALTDCYISTS
jgi:hypothetical protein